MKYEHIIAKLLYEPLILNPRKHAVLCGFMEARLAGTVNLQAEHLAARRAEEEDDGQREVNVVNGHQIIPVHGTIYRHSEGFLSGGCVLDDVHLALDIAEHDPEVECVVLDFRTPGGEVTGVPELGRRIAELDKETIGFCDSECCSGGMWLAAQCQRFYTTASATVGSIGVWTAYLDLSRQMANAGENMQAIFAGQYKLMGAYWKPLTDDEKKILQGQVDRIYDRFKAAMQTHRPVSEDSMGSGLTFDGEEAAARGLTDGVVNDLSDILEEMV